MKVTAAPSESRLVGDAKSRTIARGDVYWVDEASDDGGASRHPYVVVQDDVLNRSRVPTIVACALTSNLGRAKEPGNVLLDPDEGGLPRQSVIVVSQVESFDRARLGERVGQLSEERVREALAGLSFQQRSFDRR